MRLSRANSTFWLIWLCALLWCFLNSFDDPSSIFYSPQRAFRKSHSAVREQEAAQYLKQVLDASSDKGLVFSPVDTNAEDNDDDQLLCVGIPSVSRASEPLQHALSTLSDNLTPAQRRRLHVVVLLADKNPRAHVAYGQPWLSLLTDDVIVYHSREKGKEGVHEPVDAYREILYDVRKKGRGITRGETVHIDHSVVFEACRKRGARYMALVQDDVVFSRDWYPRFEEGIREVERKAAETGQDWLYLRLFYSELLWGWNNEDVPGYIRTIVMAYGVLITGFFFVWVYLRRCRRRRHLRLDDRQSEKMSAAPPKPISHTFNYMVARVLFLWTPAVISLFFITGRVTLHRSLNSQPQTVEMPNYGCCAQGLVFPKRHLEGLQSALREPPYRFPIDIMIDWYERDKSLTKWALDPSVMQHTGALDSSDRGRRINVWNFSFERRR